MAIDKKFVDQFTNVTSTAALASSYLVGKKDKIAADKAAVDSMRRALNALDIKPGVNDRGFLKQRLLVKAAEIVGPDVIVDLLFVNIFERPFN